jgi:hypothetical protein
MKLNNFLSIEEKWGLRKERDFILASFEMN